MNNQTQGWRCDTIQCFTLVHYTKYKVQGWGTVLNLQLDLCERNVLG